MSHWCPKSQHHIRACLGGQNSAQSGLALLVTLILLLVLMVMGAGIANIASTQSDLVAAGGASYSSCIVEKLASTASLGIGNEVGTTNGYGLSTFTYTLRITATGNFNVPLTDNKINKTFWQSNSSRSILEVVVTYTP